MLERAGMTGFKDPAPVLAELDATLSPMPLDSARAATIAADRYLQIIIASLPRASAPTSDFVAGDSPPSRSGSRSSACGTMRIEASGMEPNSPAVWRFVPNVNSIVALSQSGGVVAGHVARGLVPGGFVKVDVFFVISGYLISRIILTELRTNAFSVAGFYAKRVKRIFPALISVLIAVWAGGLCRLDPRALCPRSASSSWTALSSPSIFPTGERRRFLRGCLRSQAAAAPLVALHRRAILSALAPALLMLVFRVERLVAPTLC